MRPLRQLATACLMLVPRRSRRLWRRRQRHREHPADPCVDPAVAATTAKPIGLTQQFVATGTYSDAHTQDLSASVTWRSADPAKATIGTSGLARTFAVESTTITASLDGIGSNAATLTVIPATVTSIVVTPSSPRRGPRTRQFFATGTLSDGSTQDISATASWQSSATPVATIGASGLATGAPSARRTSSHR